MKYLFDRYYKPLVLWATSFLNNIPHAEDTVQEFFIRLWEKNNTRSLEPATFKSFLYTSVRNLALDRLEKKDPLQNASDICFFESPYEEYDNLKEEMLISLKKEIDKLPSRSKAVLQCIYLTGLSYKETANQLGISVSTVNTLVVNAVKKIKQAYPEMKEISLLIFMITEKKYLTNLS